MATGTGPLTVQDILNRVWNPSGTAPTAAPDSLTVYLGSGSAMVGSGSGQVSGQPFFVLQPAFRQFVLDSVTTGSASATGTVTTGLGGYRGMAISLRVSTITGTASTLQVYIETRLDGPTGTFVSIGAFNEIASASAGAFHNGMLLMRDGHSTGNVTMPLAQVNLGDAVATGTVRGIGWGDDLRVRRTVSGGTTAPIFTYTVYVNAFS